MEAEFNRIRENEPEEGTHPRTSPTFKGSDSVQKERDRWMPRGSQECPIQLQSLQMECIIHCEDPLFIIVSIQFRALEKTELEAVLPVNAATD